MYTFEKYQKVNIDSKKDARTVETYYNVTDAQALLF